MPSGFCACLLYIVADQTCQNQLHVISCNEPLCWQRIHSDFEVKNKQIYFIVVNACSIWSEITCITGTLLPGLLRHSATCLFQIGKLKRLFKIMVSNLEKFLQPQSKCRLPTRLNSIIKESKNLLWRVCSIHCLFKCHLPACRGQQ